ncbi:hypothetical protein ABEB36_001705 [Hypothenemus hampei]|uniref:Uncharacterized protein n=1 Tax=Hypothenemus hampei TaxID=57062 RepID=A0ABD1FI07_HYPHA
MCVSQKYKQKESSRVRRSYVSRAAVVMLKQMPPPFYVQRWQSTTDIMSEHPMRRAAAGFVYHARNSKRKSYPFRPPPDPNFWKDFQPPPQLNYPLKVRDYHMLPSFYRNVMPPPPNINRPLVMMEPPRRWTTSGIPVLPQHQHVPPPCNCGITKSKSVEDVRDVTVEWSETVDYNGNHVKMRGGFEGRHSMEDLLEGGHGKIRQRKAYGLARQVGCILVPRTFYDTPMILNNNITKERFGF